MSNLTDPGWAAQFIDRCAPARQPRARCWQRDLAEFNEALRSRFALPAGGRRIFGWQVRQAVATHFGLTRAELAGASRLASCVWPRQVAMYLCVRFAGLSWIQGTFYGVGAAVIAIIARSAVKLVRAGSLWAEPC